MAKIQRNQREVVYVGFYDVADGDNSVAGNVAASDKMDYICSALKRIGRGVHVLSPLWTRCSTGTARYRVGRTIEVADAKRVTLSPCLAVKSRFGRNLVITFSLAWLFLQLVVRVRRSELILVYHTEWLSIPVRWAKRLKGFKVVLEVEEIYGQIWQKNRILKRWEKKLIEEADYIIAVSDVLAKILGDRVKAVLYGNYSIPEFSRVQPPNNVIRVIFAGTIEDTSGGAYKAAECARWLPSNYKVDICGSGSQASIMKLQGIIQTVNDELSREACVYNGLILGKQFTEFLQAHHIAISPQINGANMLTAFPSKIIKYLSNNLRVVSTRIESVDKSRVAPLITFSEDDSARSIADAILKVDLNSPYNTVEFIKQLDDEFVQEFKQLMQ